MQARVTAYLQDLPVIKTDPLVLQIKERYIMLAVICDESFQSILSRLLYARK